MQANTVSGANRTVNFHNFSVEKRDPFSLRDGRFVGHDGFVVPKDFDEFHKRFPDYVRNWVRRHEGASASREDVEDWTQDLLIHLRYLPLNSRHRDAGKEDVIQTFDPIKHFGANQARFQNYINLCLTNEFRSLHSKRMQDALSRPGNMSLDTQRNGTTLALWMMSSATRTRFTCEGLPMLPKNGIKIELLSASSWILYAARIRETCWRWKGLP